MNRIEMLEQLKAGAGTKFDFLGHHFVALGGSYRALDDGGNEVGEAKPFLYSGWVIAFGSTWCFVTAGHILDRLDKRLKLKEATVTGCALFDFFSPDAPSKEPIPFPYEATKRFYIWDDDEDKDTGLDFGIIVLSAHYAALLQSNGIVPVTEENWLHQHEISFDSYCIFGLPSELRNFGSREPGGIPVEAYPALVKVTELDSVPEGIRETRFRRFVGQLPDDLPLEKLDGMSGGPIIGFSEGGYGIVAIQSSWLRDRKIVFGCPVPIFAGLIQQLIAQASSTDAG